MLSNKFIGLETSAASKINEITKAVVKVLFLHRVATDIS